jgi:hypothetical protein
MRPIPLVALIASGLTAASAAPTAANDGARMNVDFKITRRGADAALLEGKMPLEQDRTMAFEQKAPNGPQRVELKLWARPHDGVVSIQVELDEQTAEGEHVKWAPTFQARRGEKVDANVDWNGAGRRLELTVR